MSHVLEHFDRDVGLKVLSRLEQISNHLIYVETPNGFLEQTDFDGNPFQRHLSGWFPHDLESRGYTIFGSGPKWLRKPAGKSTFLPEKISRSISRGMQWYYYKRPDKAAAISGIRYLDNDGNLRSV